ncbi:MAG: nucleoside 2-deoxyribosyltransferase [Sulfurovum sp.]|nr:nucleoside 2-deoxyribosyltransferase [Sulfurovum sp.]
MLKIYLAGPDVFEINAIEEGKRLKALCKKYGFMGLFPLDNEIACDGTAYEIAKEIREANIKLIEECDIVLANLAPFRGLEPDSGTVYEVGYGTALGKKVYAYASDRREMIERIREAEQLPIEAAHCSNGKVMEDFGLSHNLMMLDIVIADDVEEALNYLAKLK